MLYRVLVTGEKRSGPSSVGRWVTIARCLGLACELGLGALLAYGCGGKEAPVASADDAFDALQPPLCGVDEVREYRCDALLPRTSALPAPEPYETCPSAIEVHDAMFPPRSGAGRFDAARTERMRRRARPGQQCCYSWCGALTVVDPGTVVDRCKDPLAFHESYCIAALERGTNGGTAAPPYSACPAAIKPPAGAAFSVPPGAFLDVKQTAERRKAQEALCCYGWCSHAPPGTALERGR